MDTFILWFIAIAIMSLVYYQLQKRIGENQAVEWQDFVKDNPQYFKKAVNPIHKPMAGEWTDDQKKSS